MIACVMIRQLETSRKLEIELDRGTLMITLQCVLELNVDLWAVEGAIPRVDLPLIAVVLL